MLVLSKTLRFQVLIAVLRIPRFSHSRIIPSSVYAELNLDVDL